MDHSLSKKERLKNKKTLERVFLEGNAIVSFPIKMIYLESANNQEGDIQIAVVAPKKKFKRAVDRNRIKRLLREAYRLNKQLIFNNTERNFALVFLYLGKELPEYQLVEDKIVVLLKKFIQKISDENKA